MDVIEPSEEIYSCYLRPVLAKSKRIQVINRCVARLREKEHLFDTIAFRGMSGALIAPSVADVLGKQLLMVRKAQDDSHGGLVEGARSRSRYIVLDDVVESGNTVAQVILNVWNRGLVADKCPVAVMTYRGNKQDGSTFHFCDDHAKSCGVDAVTIWTTTPGGMNEF